MSISSIKTGLIRDELLVGNPPFSPFAFESLATATGTGSSTTITFSSIPANFQHLQIRAIMRTTRTATDSACMIRFNSDSGSNYAYHWFYGDGTNVTGAGVASATSGFIAQGTGSTAAANIVGVGIMDIHDYASTTKNKTIRSFTGFDANGVFTTNISSFSALWMNTSAINSISLIVNDGSNWTTQTQFALYGIKGA